MIWRDLHLLEMIAGNFARTDLTRIDVVDIGRIIVDLDLHTMKETVMNPAGGKMDRTNRAEG